MSDEVILAMSVSADYYPGLGDGSIDAYDGNSIEWTFAVPRTSVSGPGIYELRFVRTLREEEDAGWPTLGADRKRPDDEA